MPVPRNLSLDGCCSSGNLLSDFSKVSEYLYVSGSSFPSDLQTMQKLRIATVINCTATCPNFFPDHLSYLRLNLKDEFSESIVDSFEPAFTAIEATKLMGFACLIHCTAGQSRSVTIAIGYLMRSKGWNLVSTLAHLQCCRPCSSPNVGFMAQLCAYECSLYNVPSIDLEKYSSDRFSSAKELEAFPGAMSKQCIILPPLITLNDEPTVKQLYSKLNIPNITFDATPEDIPEFGPCGSTSKQSSFCGSNEAFRIQSVPSRVNLWASDC